MLLKFIGKDGSMGFKKGRIYRVQIQNKVNDDWVWVSANKTQVPYASFANLLKNWQEIK